MTGKYSLDKVIRAAFVCISYGIANPLMIYLIAKYVMFVFEIRYLWVCSIYGYAYSVFILTIILMLIPINWLRWIFLGVSAIISIVFICS